MNMKVIALVAAGIVLAAGVGYVVGNPESIAALSGDLTGAASKEGTYLQSTGFALEINDVAVGNLRSIEGCETTFAQVDASTGSEAFAQSSMSAIEYAPCTVIFRGVLAKPVLDWVKDTLRGDDYDRTVEVGYLTRDGKVFGGLTFRDAFITGFSTTALDAASTPQAEPETTLSFRFNRLEEGANVSPTGAGSKSNGTKDERLGAALFSTDISPDVVRISGINITVPAIEHTTGLDAKSKAFRPGRPDLGDVTFIAVQQVGKKNLFVDWAKDVAEGKEARKDITVQLQTQKGTVGQTYLLDDVSLLSIGSEPVTSERAPLKTVVVVKPARVDIS